MTAEPAAATPDCRAVIDTSSLVAPSLRRDLQLAAHEGAFAGVWSPWIIAELNRILVWHWIKRTNNQLSRDNQRRCSAAAKTMMQILLPTFILVGPLPPYPPAWENLRDMWDHPIWPAAKASDAQYVVSENTHDYPPLNTAGEHTHEGITYLSGRAFLALLKDRQI